MAPGGKKTPPGARSATEDSAVSRPRGGFPRRRYRRPDPFDRHRRTARGTEDRRRPGGGRLRGDARLASWPSARCCRSCRATSAARSRAATSRSAWSSGRSRSRPWSPARSPGGSPTPAAGGGCRWRARWSSPPGARCTSCRSASAGLLVARLVLGVGDGWVFTAGAAWTVDLAPPCAPRAGDRALRPGHLGRPVARPADRRGALRARLLRAGVGVRGWRRRWWALVVREPRRHDTARPGAASAARGGPLLPAPSRRPGPRAAAAPTSATPHWPASSSCTSRPRAIGHGAAGLHGLRGRGRRRRGCCARAACPTGSGPPRGASRPGAARPPACW